MMLMFFNKGQKNEQRVNSVLADSTIESALGTNAMQRYRSQFRTVLGQIVRMKENISPQVFSTDLEILNRSGQSYQLIPTRLNLPLSFSQVIY